MHWTGKVESVAFTILGRDVAWYGIILTTAMLTGLFVGSLLAKRVKVKSEDLLELFLIAIPLAILFARLGYVFSHPKYFFVSDFGWSDFVSIFAVWDGGLTIMTGAPGGILGGLIWSKWRKVDFLRLSDAIVCVVLLSQAMGRWGNFFNQEIYGAAISNPNLQFFPIAVYIAREGGFFMATFFYEMVLNLIGFVALYLVSRRLNLRGSGVVLYAFTYALIRFIMEFMRDDGEVYAVVNYNQIICAVVVVAAACLLTIMIIREKKQNIRVWYAKGVPLKLVKPASYAIHKEGKTDL